MDVGEFAALYDRFCDFHAFFAPTFGRKQWRERSQHYLQALLVQSQERRNAENLAETVPASPRVLQRFLTEARWEDLAVTEQLHAYLSARLQHPDGVWVIDESGFPKQGQKSAGVARQYCGTLGKVANCQIGVFLAYVSPLGRTLVDKSLYLPSAWVEDTSRCEQADIPEAEQVYRTKPQLARTLLQRAKHWNQLQAQWVAGDDAYGQSPALRDWLREQGFLYVLDVPENTFCWVQPSEQDEATRHTVQERADALPSWTWQPLTVAEGAQGERTYLFACETVRENRDKQPGVTQIAVYRKNLDGSQARYYYAHAPQDTPLIRLAQVAASRWNIETEFETNKSDIGLDEYEVRSWHGWHHHMIMCLLASAFLLTLQQEWGEKDAHHNTPAGLLCRQSPAAQAQTHAR
jgi:SRSO17 transposase